MGFALKIRYYVVFPSLIMLVVAFQPAQAQQLAFKKARLGSQTQFEYRWKDIDNNSQTLKFSLENKALFSRFRNFKAYQVATVQRTILVGLKKATAKLDPKEVNVTFINRYNDIEIKVTGTDTKQLDRVITGLNQIRDKIQGQFLSKNYYNLLTDKFGQAGAKPDHVRFVNESLVDMQPIATAILSQKANLKGRQLTEYVLGFVQSIPYSTLESRLESNGAGFSPPLRLLSNNQGDCDSKVTLMAALLGAIYPNNKTVIIYLPEHALIGVQMGHRNADKIVKLEGRTYILAEPTGPAMIPLAEIAKSSEFFIDGQQFSHEIF
ncbi:MAG: hypothetical protein ACI9FJ_000386 [Alteromonadaceae bacterium]|jgi:hypothetical protein